MTDDNPNGKVLFPFLVRSVIGLVLTVVGAHLSWATLAIIDLKEKAARIESIASRLDGLEIGRTTPMAKETRSELNAIWRELEKFGTVRKTP